MSTHFDVKALGENDRILSLSIIANDEQEAVRKLKGQGYSVLTVKPKHFVTTFLRKRQAKFSLVLFSQQLLSLLDAGVSLIDVIETLGKREKRSEQQAVMKQLANALYEGQPLSQALQQFPQLFPPLYIATVRSSEKTGNLSEALTRYIAYRAQIETVQKKIISASIYPLLLVIVGLLVVFFLLGYVVPKFSLVYEDLGKSLPWTSQVLLDWGKLIENHAAAVVIGITGFIGVAVYFLRQAKVRQWIVLKLWSISAIGERLYVYQLARFYRTVGMLLRGGMPVLASLKMAEDLLPIAMRERLVAAAKHIGEGKSISQAMELENLVTPVAQQMLRAGERSGNMGEMMQRIANFHDEEMARWVDLFVRLFEPLLMILIGLMVGTIIILLYTPIFELAGSIQ